MNTYFFTDNNGNPHHLCLAVYYIPAGFKPIVSAHGNSNDLKPFHPTWPSTRQRIKEECNKQGLKETVSIVHLKLVGVRRHEHLVSYRGVSSKCPTTSAYQRVGVPPFMLMSYIVSCRNVRKRLGLIASYETYGQLQSLLWF